MDKKIKKNMKILLYIGITVSLISMLTSMNDTPIITIRTIGDSTMADYEENTTDVRGWGEMLCHFVNSEKARVVNYARGGRSSRSFYEEGLWQNVMNDTRPGDYILIQFAHNDEKNNGEESEDGRGTAPWGQYKEHLEKYVDEARAKGATPIFVGPIVRRYFDKEKKHITRKGQHDLGNDQQLEEKKSGWGCRTYIFKDGQYVSYSGLKGIDPYEIDHIEVVSDKNISQRYGTGEEKGIIFLKIGTKNDTTELRIDATKNYYYVMQMVAEEKEVPFVDMTEATKKITEATGYDMSKQLLYVAGDNTHTRPYGAAIYARAAMTAMKKMGILEEVWKEEELCVNPMIIDMGDIYTGVTADWAFDAIATANTEYAEKGNLTWKRKYTIESDDEVSMHISGESQSDQKLEADTTGSITICASMTPQKEGKIEKKIKVKSIATDIAFAIKDAGRSGMTVTKATEDSAEVIIRANVIEPKERTAYEISLEDLIKKPKSNNGIRCNAIKAEGIEITENSIRPTEGEWPADIDESGTRYIELYAIIPEASTLNEISVTTDKELCYRIAMSRGKNFYPRTTVGECFNDGHKEEMTFKTSATIKKNERLVIRIYPWSKQKTAKAFTIKEIKIKGTLYK